MANLNTPTGYKQTRDMVSFLQQLGLPVFAMAILATTASARAEVA